jgi:hypothetical protein
MKVSSPARAVAAPSVDWAETEEKVAARTAPASNFGKNFNT